MKINKIIGYLLSPDQLTEIVSDCINATDLDIYGCSDKGFEEILHKFKLAFPKCMDKWLNALDSR